MTNERHAQPSGPAETPAQARLTAFRRELEQALVDDVRGQLARFLMHALSARVTTVQVTAALCDVVDEAMARGLTMRRVHELIQPVVMEMAPSVGSFSFWGFSHARGDVARALGRDFRDRASEVLFSKVPAPLPPEELAPEAAVPPRGTVHRDIRRIMGVSRAGAPAGGAVSRIRAAVKSALATLVIAVGLPVTEALAVAIAAPNPPVPPPITAPAQVVPKLVLEPEVVDPSRPLWRFLLDPKITADTWDGELRTLLTREGTELRRVNRDAAIAASRALTAEQRERQIGRFKPLEPGQRGVLTKEDWEGILREGKIPPRRVDPNWKPPF